MKREQTILLVGGPDSGKTNYLARLWLAVRDRKSQLEVDGTPADLAYLNEIASYYLHGHFAPHTPKNFLTNVVIPVKTNDKNNQIAFKLTVPDVSGEEWLSIYQRRGWSIDWERMVADVAGCLLFIRVESGLNTPAIDWLTASNIFKHGIKKPAEVPTQVVLVDWLQCLISAFSENRSGNRPRIGVIVSAYDLLANEQKSLGPDAYLKSNFPLFWQFIHTLDSILDIRVFGTSIAGGDFNADHGFRDQFFNTGPYEAGSVFTQLDSGVDENKDITLPVMWTMDLDHRD